MNNLITGSLLYEADHKEQAQEISNAGSFPLEVDVSVSNLMVGVSRCESLAEVNDCQVSFAHIATIIENIWTSL